MLVRLRSMPVRWMAMQRLAQSAARSASPSSHTSPGHQALTSHLALTTMSTLTISCMYAAGSSERR